MQLLSQNQLDDDIGTISVMHARLGQDLSKSLAYHTGNISYLRHLNRKNQSVGVCLDILKGYDVMGDETISIKYNVLTLFEIDRMIDFCYRQLEKYNY